MRSVLSRVLLCCLMCLSSWRSWSFFSWFCSSLLLLNLGSWVGVSVVVMLCCCGMRLFLVYVLMSELCGVDFLD